MQALRLRHCTEASKLRVVLTPHAASGLTENDFVLAARIDALEETP